MQSKSRFSLVFSAIALLAAPSWSPVAEAAAICPSAPQENQAARFEVPQATGCFDSGNGSGNTLGDINVKIGAGYVMLDQDWYGDPADSAPNYLTVDGLNGSSGTFAIAAAGYTKLLLAFIDATPNPKPDWAIFSLPEGTDEGTWSIYEITRSGNVTSGILGGVILYGQAVQSPTGIRPVPIPAAAWLLLSGLAGLGLIRRRKTV